MLTHHCLLALVALQSHPQTVFSCIPGTSGDYQAEIIVVPLQPVIPLIIALNEEVTVHQKTFHIMAVALQF